MKKVALFVLVMSFVSISAHAYTITDRNGNVHYVNDSDGSPRTNVL